MKKICILILLILIICLSMIFNFEIYEQEDVIYVNPDEYSGYGCTN